MSTAPDILSYIREAPAERQPALENLRALCRATHPQHEEVIEYGMPAYKRDGKVDVAFASQKQYISLYVLKAEVVNRWRGEMAGATIGKGCIRFKKPSQIDFAKVEAMLRDSAGSSAAPC